jgi:hypothetical protein
MTIIHETPRIIHETHRIIHETPRIIREIPVLFRPDMAYAACHGAKTQTRRAVKDQPQLNGTIHNNVPAWWWPTKQSEAGYIHTDFGSLVRIMLGECPYGQPGDTLRMLTTWAVSPHYDRYRPRQIPKARWLRAGTTDAEYPFKFWHAGMGPKPEGFGKSRPGRFLPNKARHLMPAFRNEGVRVERVREIIARDVEAEGVETACWSDYRDLWDSINGKRPGCSWTENPWVWCVSFRRITP